MGWQITVWHDMNSLEYIDTLGEAIMRSYLDKIEPYGQIVPIITMKAVDAVNFPANSVIIPLQSVIDRPQNKLYFRSNIKEPTIYAITEFVVESGALASATELHSNLFFDASKDVILLDYVEQP